MRIAFFSEVFLPKVDGIVNSLCRLLEQLPAHGHEAILFAPESGLDEFAGTQIVNLKSVPFPLYPEMPVVFPPRRRSLNVALGDFRPNLIHTLTPALLGYKSLRWAKRNNVPVVASYHTDIPSYLGDYGLSAAGDLTWMILRHIYSLADRTLCPSNATKSQLEAHGFNNLTLWTRGVDTDMYNPQHFDAAMRHRLSDGDTDAPLLLYVGRLAKEKRIDWLRPVLAALPNARLALVGDGPDRERLEQVFAGTRTVFAGYMRNEQLARAYASADIFTFPSASETFGNVLLEAMASGLPLVAAAAGGPLDFVAHGRNGLMFSAEDQQEWIGHISRLVADDALATRIGKKARLSAEARSWQTITDALLATYAEVIAQHEPTGYTSTIDKTIHPTKSPSAQLPT